MTRFYRIGEVAALAGVSIRTLRHYDHLGVLRPPARSEAGYRLYTEGDLVTLQQVLTLRALGLPLATIAQLLERPDWDLEASLQIQRRVVQDRIRRLERVDATLGALLERRRATGEWAWELVERVTAAVGQGFLEKGEDIVEEYYSPEEMQEAWDALGRQFTPEEIREVERRWAELLAEVRANRDLEPASPEAQALAARWQALIADTYRGNTKLMRTVGKNYREGQYAEVEGAAQAEDFAFIQRAIEASRQ